MLLLSRSTVVTVAVAAIITVVQISIAHAAPRSDLQANSAFAHEPPRGWLAWARFKCNTNCTESPHTCINSDLFRQQAYELKLKDLHKLNYIYVNVDDCWMAPTRDASTNKLVADANRFPSGIKALANYMHEQDLKLGIYGDCGTATCQNYPSQIKSDTEDYFELDSSTFIDWQIDSFKFDGCNMNNSQAERRCPEFALMLRNASAQASRNVLVTCEWPYYMMKEGLAVNWPLATNACHMIRFSEDILGPGHWFDPDMIVVGNNGLTERQEVAHMAIWCMWSAPLFMSNDLRVVPEFSLHLLRNKQLLDLQADPFATWAMMTQQEKTVGEPKHQAFVKPVAPVTGACPSFAVLYFNYDALGDHKKISFVVADLLASELLLRAAVRNANQTSDANTMFDVHKCLQTLRSTDTGIAFDVQNLLVEYDGDLPAVPSVVHLHEALSLHVRPSGSVRLVKLSLKV